MTPADITVQWPTADEVARAVFTAARLEGDDPIDVLQGLGGARSRAYAFLALAQRFPTVPRSGLARKCGNPNAGPGVRKALLAAAWPWFSLERLNEVRAACGWPPMTIGEAVAAPMLYLGRPWSEFLPAAPASTDDLAAPEPKIAVPAEEIPAEPLIEATDPASIAPGGAEQPEIQAEKADEPRETSALPVEPKPPVPVDVRPEAPKPAPRPPRAPKPAKIEPVAPRPAPLKPSARALALTAATWDIRAARGARSAATAPRIIDRREGGVLPVPGEPPPGRSALDQRRAEGTM